MWIFDSSIDKKMNSFALLLVRIVVGSFMLTHGIQKYHMLMAPGPIKFADPIGLGEGPSLYMAVFAELVCSALIIIGFATRLVTIPLIVTMVVAVFVVHAADEFGVKETAALYLLIYVLLLITGSGKYSVDGLINNRHKRKVHY
jgi:putative oxidoreductase